MDWKSKERKGETFQKLTQHIIEKRYIYIHANPLAKVLGLHTTKGSYSQKQKLKLQQRSRIYATSAFCSMAEEGMVASASVVEGGAEVAIAGVKEVGVKEAIEAAEGEIIDTMAGVNFFTFSKKAFSSERVRP
jgi:hypothetical protein